MPVYDRFTGTLRVATPAGYLLPPQHGHLAGLLRSHGIVVQRLRAEWKGTAEVFSIDSIVPGRGVFEGHRTVTVEGRWGARDASASPGWYYVATAQRLGMLAGYLLEPASEDGFVTWNFLDRDLRSRSHYPVLRVLQPLSAGLEVMTEPLSGH
jgi:hypothetical protein